MSIKLEITEAELKSLILEHLSSKLGKSASLNVGDVKIKVKSKQNYKSEWEIAAFRAVYEGNI